MRGGKGRGLRRGGWDDRELWRGVESWKGLGG